MDEHVGQRLRVRRNIMGISQEKLAEMLGLTFQQVQKYERGSNRISAGRLFEISKILEVDPNWFFKDPSNDDAQGTKNNFGFAEGEQDKFIDDSILLEKETIELVKAYYSIEDPKFRKEVMRFIRSIADHRNH